MIGYFAVITWTFTWFALYLRAYLERQWILKRRAGLEPVPISVLWITDRARDDVTAQDDDGESRVMTIKEKDASMQHQIRVQKVTDLAERGIAAWPAARAVGFTAQQVRDQYVADSEDTTEYTIAGRLVTKRGHGKTMFAHLQDRSGRIQLYLRKDALSESDFELLTHGLDLGDIVWCRGTMFTTKTGEPTLKVVEVALLSKCLHPLPEKFHGLTDTEQRYRQRYLDLISNPESKAKFAMRSRITQAVRDYLLHQEFLEVETPMLHPIPGGAAARPFTTHHNAYDMKLYLRIAPELYLKRLVVGGLERVFEINRNFRNEGVSTRHNPEFTMLELYMAHGDYRSGMQLTEGLLRSVSKALHGDKLVPFGEHMLDFVSPFASYSMRESVVKVGGIADEKLEPSVIITTLEQVGIVGVGGKSYGEQLVLLFEEVVEGKLIQPTFITDYPIEISPLAKRSEHDKNVAARFELFAAGMELANAFSELNDPIDQAERFHHQTKARAAGDDEAHYFDADYVRALEYGLPPTIGMGMGIDRLTMLMTNTTSIKDVILFPTMKMLSDPEEV